MHGLGRHRPGLDHERRHSCVSGIRQERRQRCWQRRRLQLCAEISDSHIGFNKPANPDVTATLQTAINRINTMSEKPEFIVHTGDLTQLSKPSEFDTLDQGIKGSICKTDLLCAGRA
jgi:hypothetical protein